MQEYLIKIKFIPNNINKTIIVNSNPNLKLVGYKKISRYHIIPIIQFPNKKRIWLLTNEIKYSIYGSINSYY
uniref:Cytochrome b6-f complex subunit PetP n=1 Tax=Symphyocladiella dendroidea TaxID=2506487 RepID=A0A1Z1M7G7_9FLOR|nr:cytochrome b6-f complex subunit PetP [Symphyocladiella dendroidea]ARW61900.1 cytochrome b6-f complex subunit PetP [Symphyocladiella dendroidea]